MTTADTLPRRVQVEVLSARTELLFVLRAAMAMTAALWVYVALMAPAGNVGGTRNLLPFQKLIVDRPPEEQRVFRELQEGLLEAEAARSAANAWPPPESLAAQGIPPFAPDPTERAPAEWRLIESGTIVNYLGLPKTGDGPAWLLFVQEPVPGVPPDQAFEDEEHHRLASGAMLHVSTWVHPEGRDVPGRLVRMPQAEGWTQLYAVGPPAVTAARAVRPAGSK
jgi:hypothetical protein